MLRKSIVFMMLGLVLYVLKVVYVVQTCKLMARGGKLAATMYYYLYTKFAGLRRGKQTDGFTFCGLEGTADMSFLPTS